MSEPRPPDANDHSFSEWLKPGARELRKHRGPCPSAEDLVVFHEGTLPIEQMECVREHVEACGFCDAQLGRLEAATEYRQPTLWQALWILLRKPVVPYALVALLVFPAYRGVVRIVTSSEKTPHPRTSEPAEFGLGVAPISRLSLDVVRSDSQSQESPIIRLAGEDRFFLLSFFIPMKAPPYNYEVVVLRGDETPVVSTQRLKNCDGMGNCFLICNSAVFPSARYNLRVTEISPTGVTTVFHFNFEVAR